MSSDFKYFNVFTENTPFMGSNVKESLAAAESLDGPCLGGYRQLAKDNKIAISIAGFKERILQHDDGVVGGESDGEKIYNTHLIISAEGEVLAKYRKIYLFDCPKVNLMESKFTAAGDELVLLDSESILPGLPLGLTTCYDLRFPVLFHHLREAGAKAFLVPSAFTVLTGYSHWEALLRARAIENQSYVIAAAQVGRNNAKRESYGHAMIIDPWGAVVAQCSAAGGLGEATIACADLSSSFVDDIRAEMPVDMHHAAAVKNGVYSKAISVIKR